MIKMFRNKRNFSSLRYKLLRKSTRIKNQYKLRIVIIIIMLIILIINMNILLPNKIKIEIRLMENVKE